MSPRIRLWIVFDGVTRADLKAQAALADVPFERYVGQLVELGMKVREHGLSVHPSVQSCKQETERQDGYAVQTIAAVLQFQAQAERRADCDYAALSAALLWARSAPQPVTLPALWLAYDEARS